ncbi:hypothetical protein DFS34DRAFT_654265 [Phlyctochytrium arcticum]|nr:hypothetical protein DFS34DRAFT_654265 [Phlyctochytrium arcticum]
MEILRLFQRRASVVENWADGTDLNVLFKNLEESARQRRASMGGGISRRPSSPTTTSGLAPASPLPAKSALSAGSSPISSDRIEKGGHGSETNSRRPSTAAGRRRSVQFFKPSSVGVENQDEGATSGKGGCPAPENISEMIAQHLVTFADPVYEGPRHHHVNALAIEDCINVEVSAQDETFLQTTITFPPSATAINFHSKCKLLNISIPITPQLIPIFYSNLEIVNNPTSTWIHKGTMHLECVDGTGKKSSINVAFTVQRHFVDSG